jgi:NAD(P)-dependent dehydrogenase (short-subunit alcohol dehydrogenase family)
MRPTVTATIRFRSAEVLLNGAMSGTGRTDRGVSMSRRIAVTGAASGIGRSLAQELRDAGDEVIGIDLENVEVCADLATTAGRAEAVATVVDMCGGVLDGLVACAGVATPGELMVRVNFFGTTELVTALQSTLAHSDAPRVAVTGSISGTHPGDEALVTACLSGDEAGAVARAASLVETGGAQRIYPSSKSALAQWVRRTCVTPGFADAGIPLNAAAPGVVLTPMSASLFEDDAMRRLMDEAVPMPLNGYAEPEVVARVLAFLVSAENSHVTGQVVYVDGGAEASLRPAGRF